MKPLAWLARQAGRIRVRLLAVNCLVVMIPAFGLEFARVYERQLLDGLERDMQNQAALVKSSFEATLVPEQEPRFADAEKWLETAARNTRTRVRILTREQGVVADSHRAGPPEGREPSAPRLGLEALPRPGSLLPDPDPPAPLLTREEIGRAFAGARATRTRVAREPPAVFLFLAEPIRQQGKVLGVVYVTRSTNPVLHELYRIRRGLIIVLIVALASAGIMTLALAWTISRPLERLSRAARRIAAGEALVPLPSGGGGEIAELSQAFAEMTKKLDARQRYILEFAADVAHEFKSPLTSIRGAAELLAEGAADEPDARARFLSNIRLDAERLDRLVSRLLELCRIDAAEAPRTVVALRPLLTRVVRRAEGPSGDIALCYESDVEFVLAREGDLESAFINLIENALRAAPSESRVEVWVQGEAAHGEVKVSVKDSGEGVPVALRERIFERFFSTDSEGEGTGLGLAIVKSVATSHGGSIRVESEPGEGSTFIMSLPVGKT